MASITLDADPLIKSLDNVASNLTKELRIVSWKTAKKAKSLIAKQVVKELATPQKIVRAQLSTRRGSGPKATVTLKKSSRISLREFKPRQTKKGVSYRISKSQGRKIIQGAFTGPKPGLTFVKFRGHAFKRVGKSRLPIVKLFGPSPWGVFVVNKQQQQVNPQINAELRKQLAERVRFKTLKKQGVI